MNSRRKSATFVTVRRAMTNFDPLLLEKNDETKSPHPRQKIWVPTELWAVWLVKEAAQSTLLKMLPKQELSWLTLKFISWDHANIQIAKRALCNLILGSPPSKVYGTLR